MRWTGSSADTSEREPTVKLEVDPNKITLGQAEELEDLTGVPFNMLFNGGRPGPKALRALVYLTRRQEDPSYTWAQTADITFEELLDDVEVVDVDPKGGTGPTGSPLSAGTSP